MKKSERERRYAPNREQQWLEVVEKDMALRDDLAALKTDNAELYQSIASAERRAEAAEHKLKELQVFFGLVCPQCASYQVTIHHHAGNAAVPECDYNQCDECSHQWGHQ